MTKTGRSPRLPAALTLTAACSLLFSLSVPEASAVDASTCGALMGTYSIVPYSSWGTAPFPIQKTWDESEWKKKKILKKKKKKEKISLTPVVLAVLLVF